jgi:hypothetical protein
MEIKIELTIEKSDWVDEQALLRKIEYALMWPLATGGSKIINIEIKKEPE